MNKWKTCTINDLGRVIGGATPSTKKPENYENGKTAKVSVLDDNEVGFGSTEYIVFRAKEGMDEDFLYYLVCSSIIREPAIKSMVGSSGRQRVQMDVVRNLEIQGPPIKEQRIIVKFLRNLDDKIQFNNKINKNLFLPQKIKTIRKKNTGNNTKILQVSSSAMVA